MLELHSNNPQSLTFGQRGAQDGLHFLGSTRGVLPVGPDYIPTFDTLKSSLLSNLKIKEVIFSYNYTLDHQGLAVNVSCSYEPTCNVAVTALPNTVVLRSKADWLLIMSICVDVIFTTRSGISVALYPRKLPYFP